MHLDQKPGLHQQPVLIPLNLEPLTRPRPPRHQEIQQQLKRLVLQYGVPYPEPMATG